MKLLGLASARRKFDHKLRPIDGANRLSMSFVSQVVLFDEPRLLIGWANQHPARR